MSDPKPWSVKKWSDGTHQIVDANGRTLFICPDTFKERSEHIVMCVNKFAELEQS